MNTTTAATQRFRVFPKSAILRQLTLAAVMCLVMGTWCARPALAQEQLPPAAATATDQPHQVPPPPLEVLEAYARIANGPAPEQDQPQGFAGRVPFRPRDWAGSDQWPIEDRWRVGFPLWDRYQYGRVFD